MAPAAPTRPGQVARKAHTRSQQHHAGHRDEESQPEPRTADTILTASPRPATPRLTAGMTEEGAGMTEEGAGMTEERSGMTEEGAGTAVGRAGMTVVRG